MTKKISQLATLTSPDDDDEIVINDISAGVTKRMKRSDFLSLLIASGVITMYGGNSAPAGYLLCNGQEVSRSTYANLFTAIGTTYGSGDGSTTFNVPNAKGRVAVGYDASVTEFNALAKTGGEKTHILTSSEMPSHTHIQNSHNHGINDPGHNHSANNHWFQDAGGSGNLGLNTPGNGFARGLQTIGINSNSTGITIQSSTPTNQNTGGDQAHNNLQPYITFNYIIKI